MNEIEQMFYDAFLAYRDEFGNRPDILEMYDLNPQVVIGIYRVDFVIGNCAIELDGHEFHKTKEQREVDYRRERYLIRKGYTPVRFMGTEVFLDAGRCVAEAFELADMIEMKTIKDWSLGFSAGEMSAKRRK